MMNISHVCLKANSQMLEVLVQRVKTLLKLLVHVAKMPSQEQKHCGKIHAHEELCRLPDT